MLNTLVNISSVSVGAVHTHTHTRYFNKINKSSNRCYFILRTKQADGWTI